MKPEKLLRDMLRAAIDAAQPAICVPPHLPTAPKGRTVVVGAGKAAAAMAQAFETHWPGDFTGAVVTRHGSKLPASTIEVLEASHPVPDKGSLNAARRMLDAVAGLTADDLVVVLLSGGASSLLCLPGEGLTLDDKLAVNRALLRSGATITDMNCVRRHLSAIKGGRLARAAAPARVVTLAISDVPGDDPAGIGSGPTVGDPTSYGDARNIVERFALDLPETVRAHLEREPDETPAPGDPSLANTEYRLIATPQMALDAAAKLAQTAGLDVVILGDALEGEARDVARQHADLAKKTKPGTLLLSGGELTVTIKGEGTGGPNTEYALALAEALDGAENIWALAADTDGIDGAGDNAGALVRPETAARARDAGFDLDAMLAANDSYPVFDAVGDLVKTGPMQTNVNDFRAIFVV